MSRSRVSERGRGAFGGLRRTAAFFGQTSARRLREQTGSAVAEFTLVIAPLCLLTLAVLQLALALHVRNTLLDAASEGARFAALADSDLAAGEQRSRDLIKAAIGDSYAGDISATLGSYLGSPAIVMTVVAPLPIFGLIGLGSTLEVTGHAAQEILD